jgi:hypothetical protein
MKIETEGAAINPSNPKNERPPSTQLRKAVFGGSRGDIEAVLFRKLNSPHWQIGARSEPNTEVLG